MRFLAVVLIVAAPCLVFSESLIPPHELYHLLGGMPNEHKGYFPYIGHYNYRIIADHVIDQTITSFDPDNVKPGDLIYINVWYLPWFEEHVHDHIRYPYILASGDVGRWLPDPHKIKKLLYDPKLAAWFCRNLLFSYHPKLFQMPMGQDLSLFGYPVDELKETDAALKRPFVKKHLLSMNFLPRPWGDRDKIMRMFEYKSYCFCRMNSSIMLENGLYKQPVNRPVFYQDLAESKFTLSPIGLEWDCVRTWEAWIFDCIPIVEHSFIDPLYDGLPTVFVHDWTEINEEFLCRKYEELKNISNERAYFQYWNEKMLDVQNKIRNNDLQHATLEATLFNQRDLIDLSDILLQHNKERFPLLCKGFLATARVLQILREVPLISLTFLHDPWMNRDTFSIFEKHVVDCTLLKHQRKLKLLENEESFDQLISNGTNFSLFFDLTYQRHSLLRDFNNFRHRLKEDIKEITQSLSSGTLVCGNMSHYPYVSEVLSSLSQTLGISIEIKGNFWFFVVPAK